MSAVANQIEMPDTKRERLGFRDGDKGTHSSRTLMFRELDVLLANANERMSTPDYRRLVVEDNILGKPTRMTQSTPLES